MTPLPPSDKKLRVVFVSTMTGYAWGGSEELWSQAAVRLHEAGHFVAASTTLTEPPSPKLRALEKAGLVLRLRAQPRGALLKSLWQRLTGLRPKQAEKEWLRRQSPDLVLISQGGVADGLDWMNFCRDEKLPFAVVIHSASDYHWMSDTESCAIAAAFRAAQWVYFVSQRNRRQVELQIGESLPHARVIWNPNSVAALSAQPWPDENPALRLACVGRLEPAAKGQDILFQVLAQPAWWERPITVNLYGAGIGENMVRAMAKQLRIPPVNFCGHVSDLGALWRENHILVLASRFEGLPLTLVEAMWCGRPAIVTDVGGNAELCVDGETGFVATAPAIATFADAMERAWQQRTNWQKMGLAARARIERLLPKDPIGDFCSLLLESAESAKRP